MRFHKNFKFEKGGSSYKRSCDDLTFELETKKLEPTDHDLKPYIDNGTVRWTNYLGHNLLKEATFEMDGVPIQTHQHCQKCNAWYEKWIDDPVLCRKCFWSNSTIPWDVSCQS